VSRALLWGCPMSSPGRPTLFRALCERVGFLTLVWGGHSCPPPLTLIAWGQPPPAVQPSAARPASMPCAKPGWWRLNLSGQREIVKGQREYFSAQVSSPKGGSRTSGSGPLTLPHALVILSADIHSLANGYQVDPATRRGAYQTCGMRRYRTFSRYAR